MYYLLFLLITQLLINQDCSEINNNIIELSYEQSIEYQKKYYEKCKENCEFLRLMVSRFSKSSENNFLYISEYDIQNSIKCDIITYKRKPPAGLREGIIIYYLRKNNIDNLFDIYKEEEIRQHVGYYIYYKHIKKDMDIGCNSVLDLEKKNTYCLTIDEALLLYECGEIAKAKEVAQRVCKELKSIYEKSQNAFEILQFLKCDRILGPDFYRIEEKIIKKEKGNRSYLFELYGF